MRPKFLTLIFAFFVAACSSSDSTGPRDSIEGTYTLKTVNGSTLPITITDAGSTFRVNSGSLTINTGNTFSDVTNISVQSGGQTVTVNSTCTGTFTQNGNSVAFDEATSNDPNCGGTFTGSWSGNTMTVAFDANLIGVFQK